MNEDWKDKLHDAMAGFEESAPEGLWNDIEERLSASTYGVGNDKGKSRKTHVVLLRSFFAAACVACILGVFFMLPGEGGHSEMAEVNKKKNTIPQNIATESSKLMAKVDDSRLVTHAEIKTGRILTAAENVNVDKLQTLENDEESLTASSGNEQTEQLVTEVEPTKKEKSVVVRNSYPSSEAKGTTRGSLCDIHEMSKKKQRDMDEKFSATLYAANSIGNDNGAEGMQMLALRANDGLLSNISSAEGELVKGYYVGKSVDESVKHHAPIRVGLSVRYALGRRLGVETGIVYSYLSSDISQGEKDNSCKTKQKLHFVGIPVNVDYTIWNNKWIRVYVSGGGMAEKNVKGKSMAVYELNGQRQSSAEYDVKMKELLWSVNAAAGLQLDITRSVGIYAEPGIGYYFDNGSALKTYYSEKPTSFNLKVGLRYSFM